VAEAFHGLVHQIRKHINCLALLPKEGSAATTTAMPTNDIAGRMGGATGGNRWIILALAALLAALVTNGLWF